MQDLKILRRVGRTGSDSPVAPHDDPRKPAPMGDVDSSRTCWRRRLCL